MEGKTFVCNNCHGTFPEHEHIDVLMNGTDDVYSLDVCGKCHILLSGDYYSPEAVDEIVENIE